MQISSGSSRPSAAESSRTCEKDVGWPARRRYGTGSCRRDQQRPTAATTAPCSRCAPGPASARIASRRPRRAPLMVDNLGREDVMRPRKFCKPD